MPKYNYWEQLGKPTSYNPLPTGWGISISIPLIQNLDLVVKFKAKSATNAQLLVTDTGGASISKIINLGTEFSDYEFSWFQKPNNSGIFCFYDNNSRGDIVIQDIKLTEKPLGRATINGIDGFQSGKWTFSSDVKVTDDTSLAVNAPAAWLESSIVIPCLPSTAYSLKYDATNGLGFVGNPCNSAGSSTGANFNGGAFLNGITFTTPADCYFFKLRLLPNKAGVFTLSNPMLNIGSPVPYEKKRGERMVPPQIAGKNLFSIKELVQTGWSVPALKKDYQLKPNTVYTLSSNVPSMGAGSSNVYFNGSSTPTNGVNEGKSVAITTDSTGVLYVAIPANPDRLYTQDLISGKYWIQLEEGPATSYEPYRVRSARKATKVPQKNIVPIDLNEWEVGHINSAGDNTINDLSMRMKGKYPIEGNTGYIFNAIANRRMIIYYYDASGVFITTPNAFWVPGTTFTTPANAAFYRISARTIDGTALYLEDIASSKLQIEKGTAPTEFEPFRLGLRKATKYPGGKNLFNRLTTMAGVALDLANGNVAPNAPYSVSDFIEVRPSLTYTKTSTNGFCFYDADKKLLVNGTGTSMTSHANARYLRVTFPTSMLDTMQVEEGPATPYEPYKPVGRRASKGLEFKEKIGDYVNCGSVDLRDSNIEVEFRCKFNQTLPNTHAVLALHTYSTGILINQIGTSLLVYVGHSAAAANYANFFEAGKDVEVKVILDKTNNTITVYKNGVVVSGLSYPQYVNYPGIIAQNLYVAGHPSSYNAPDVAMKYMKVKKNGEVLLEHDYTNPRSIVGTKVKANVGLDGTIVGSPYQLNRLARR